MSNNLDNQKKHTYTTSARLDITTLAALVKYYIEERGFSFESRNQALYTAFEHTRLALDLQKPSLSESVTILESAGLFSQKNKNTKLIKELRKESEQNFSDAKLNKQTPEPEPDLDKKIKEAQEIINRSFDKDNEG